MWQRCANVFCVILFGLALAAMPSLAIVESYVGGSAVHGSVEDGHYFVNPGRGRPNVEVSEATWRKVYWVELLWPWSAIVPGFAGLALAGRGKGPSRKPSPVRPAETPAWMLRACLVGTGVTVGGTLLCWYATRTPWATMLVGWILICLCGATLGWLGSRSLRRQSAAEPDAAPDPGGV